MVRWLRVSMGNAGGSRDRHWNHPEDPMLAPIPVHRRAHNWYGIRSAPDAARPKAPASCRDPRAPVPVLRIVGLPIPIGSAPVDRRLTALL